MSDHVPVLVRLPSHVFAHLQKHAKTDQRFVDWLRSRPARGGRNPGPGLYIRWLLETMVTRAAEPAPKPAPKPPPVVAAPVPKPAPEDGLDAYQRDIQVLFTDVHRRFIMPCDGVRELPIIRKKHGLDEQVSAAVEAEALAAMTDGLNPPVSLLR